MNIQKVPISEVNLWDKNPRNIKTKDFERLKKQIKDLGVYKPMIAVKENGGYTVLGGNMRLRALKELGFKDVDISVVNAKTEAQKIKFALSDNDRAGEYDEQMLAELVYPHIEEINLEDYKVDLGEAVDLQSVIEDFGPNLDGEEDEKADIINVAFSGEQLKDYLKKDILSLNPNDVLPLMMNKSRAAFEFNRLATGKEDGYWISIFWNPHRLEVCGKNRPSSFVLWKDKHEGNATQIARYGVEFKENVVLPTRYISNYHDLGTGGGVVVQEFRPSIARDLVLLYAKGKDFIRILDPCHGWGGRLIGALATLKKVHYVGYDPARKTGAGIKEMAEFLLSANVIKNLGSSVDIFCEPFEDAEIVGKFDLAITSPPYFDTEIYEKEKGQACNRYSTYVVFVDGFLHPMIKKTMGALLPGAVFILNVGTSKYDMVNSVNEIANSLGFKTRKIDGGFRQIGGYGKGARASDEDGTGEPFIEISK